MNYSPSLCYSPEKRYIFAKFLILLIHWRKHGNVNSKFSEFSYAKLKSRNPQTTTINMTRSFVSYVVRYNKTLIDWIYRVITSLLFPRHQRLPSAQPLSIVFVSGYNTLATTLIPYIISSGTTDSRILLTTQSRYNYALIAWPNVNPKYHTNASMAVRNIEVIGV